MAIRVQRRQSSSFQENAGLWRRTGAVSGRHMEGIHAARELRATVDEIAASPRA
jgi:hypothetical protein